VRKLVERWVSWCALVAGALVVFVCTVVFYEVVSRYVFGAPTTWSIDVSTYALFWATFLGAPYALREGAHVAVDVLVRRAGAATRRRVGAFNTALVALFAALIAWRGGLACWDAYVYGEVTLSALRFPLYVPLLAIPVGGTLLLMQALVLLARGSADEGDAT
jgi:C4-dicarboxylate transporter, DctQ subunit